MTEDAHAYTNPAMRWNALFDEWTVTNPEDMTIRGFPRRHYTMEVVFRRKDRPIAAGDKVRTQFGPISTVLAVHELTGTVWALDDDDQSFPVTYFATDLKHAD